MKIMGYAMHQLWVAQCCNAVDRHDPNNFPLRQRPGASNPMHLRTCLVTRALMCLLHARIFSPSLIQPSAY